MAQKLLRFLLTVLVVGVIFWLLSWTIGAVGLGNPFDKLARIVLIVAAVFALINAILEIFDKAFVKW